MSKKKKKQNNTVVGKDIDAELLGNLIKLFIIEDVYTIVYKGKILGHYKIEKKKNENNTNNK